MTCVDVHILYLAEQLQQMILGNMLSCGNVIYKENLHAEVHIRIFHVGFAWICVLFSVSCFTRHPSLQSDSLD